MNSKKLYRASQAYDVLFACEPSEHLRSVARKFLIEEDRYNNKENISIVEITDESEIPEAWKNALIWGCDEEMTPAIFLSEQKEFAKFDQKEYEEFLRLKKIYQNE